MGIREQETADLIEDLCGRGLSVTYERMTFSPLGAVVADDDGDTSFTQIMADPDLAADFKLFLKTVLS